MHTLPLGNRMLGLRPMSKITPHARHAHNPTALLSHPSSPQAGHPQQNTFHYTKIMSQKSMGFENHPYPGVHRAICAENRPKGCRVERSAPCRVRPLGLRLPSKRTSPFFGGYPSSNRTCSFPAYCWPRGTQVTRLYEEGSFALRLTSLSGRTPAFGSRTRLRALRVAFGEVPSKRRSPFCGASSYGLLGPSGYPIASLGPHCVRRVCPNHISVCL